MDAKTIMSRIMKLEENLIKEKEKVESEIGTIPSEFYNSDFYGDGRKTSLEVVESGDDISLEDLLTKMENGEIRYVGYEDIIYSEIYEEFFENLDLTDFFQQIDSITYHRTNDLGSEINFTQQIGRKLKNNPGASVPKINLSASDVTIQSLISGVDSESTKLADSVKNLGLNSEKENDGETKDGK